jgi:hypothetical protein
VALKNVDFPVLGFPTTPTIKLKTKHSFISTFYKDYAFTMVTIFKSRLFSDKT